MRDAFALAMPFRVFIYLLLSAIRRGPEKLVAFSSSSSNGWIGEAASNQIATSIHGMVKKKGEGRCPPVGDGEVKINNRQLSLH